MDFKICRICSENSGSLYIFDSDEGLQISAKIMYCCSNINIAEGDGLPAYVCGSCEQELSASYRFVLKCEAADSKLRSLSTDVQAAAGCCEPKQEVDVKLEQNCDDDDDRYMQPEELTTKEIDVKQEHEPDAFRAKRPYKRRRKSNTSSLECSMCGRVCTNQSTLAVHMRSHTDKKPYPCTVCDKKYKDSGNLKRHMLRNHYQDKRERNFICETCGKGFFSKNEVKIHMRIHTGETPYSCPLCPMRFSQISTMQRHKKRHSGEKPHICSTCSKKFCTKEELKIHYTVHTTEKKYPCPLCNVLIKYQNNLKKHIELHSRRDSYICNHCGRTFNMKGNLKIHIDRQHSEKSGYCSTCSKNVSNMEAHMWRHTGQRPLKCELCSSSFYELKALARHMNFRHKNADKHKCVVDGCTVSFPSRPMLEFHIAKLHGTHIPFPCDRCSRGFYRKNDLARHKIGTHKERLTH